MVGDKMGQGTNNTDNPERRSYGVLFKQLSMAYAKSLRRAAARYDLTAAQAMILIYLSKADHPVNQRELETYYRLSNPTVTGLMKRMEAKNFIQREVSKEDARFKYITLTPKAIEVVSSVQGELDDTDRCAVQSLNTEEEQQFYRFLTCALENLCAVERAQQSPPQC